MSFMESCREKVRGRNLRIVYPEGVDERAVKAAEQLTSEGLGEAIVLNDVTSGPEFEKFIENKKIEWDNYRAQVTTYELEQYLKVV